MTWAATGAATISAFGSSGQAQAQAAQSRADRRKRKGYFDEAMGRANAMAGAGEQSFLGETGAPLAELGAARQDMLTGNAAALNQGAGQMGANLARQGSRGGQAATLMNRGTGQMANDANSQINQMAIDEASQRRQMRGGYFAGKAGLATFGG